VKAIGLKRLLLVSAIPIIGCSSAPPCDPRPPGSFEPLVNPLQRRSYEYVTVALAPVCVRRLAGAILAGPEGNSWQDEPNEFDPRVEVYGPLPSVEVRQQSLRGEGRFDFGVVPAGQYVLKASACGWETAFIVVVVSRAAPAHAAVWARLDLGT
jgi:hypothetical protein